MSPEEELHSVALKVLNNAGLPNACPGRPVFGWFSDLTDVLNDLKDGKSFTSNGYGGFKNNSRNPSLEQAMPNKDKLNILLNANILMRTYHQAVVRQDKNLVKDLKELAIGIRRYQGDPNPEKSFNDERVQNLTQAFLARHEKMQKNEFWQSIRRTKVRSDMNLVQIIDHAQKANNRSRKVLQEMGIMDTKGNLINDDAKELYNLQKNALFSPPPTTQLPSVKKLQSADPPPYILFDNLGNNYVTGVNRNSTNNGWVITGHNSKNEKRNFTIFDNGDYQAQGAVNDFKSLGQVQKQMLSNKDQIFKYFGVKEVAEAKQSQTASPPAQVMSAPPNTQPQTPNNDSSISHKS